MTIEQLQALPDKELNALAAKLRGWYDCEASNRPCYHDNETLAEVCANWTPATSRDQSGALLEWAVAHGVESKINIGSEPYIEITWPDAPENLHSLNGADWIEILGSDARSQTIAFCAAMLAIEGGSK